MVGRRHKSSRRLAASHQRSWLWGRHAVLETLAAGRWTPLEVRVAAELDLESRDVVAQGCAQLDVPIEIHPHDQLTRWCGTGEHQGLLALMPAYQYLTIEEALAGLPATPLILILDRIQDPHNFGAILRSADVFGVDMVFVAQTEQANVTPHVARSSAGGVNHVPLCQVETLSDLPRLLWERHRITTCAAVGGSSTSVMAADLRRPTAIVIGNEGSGVSDELRAACGGQISIPQQGHVESLNAAVAAGILLYEARRQRGHGAVS
ncbi:MAG: 23S rRNA (guanosine(2251)-2'-O)-methyltransferase RlmB [Planctomycetaceae bacterium]|nr:23S rRNA (guanosine(2251)-2'-O)-methyltransferase RlmB [Planctomycetaceae bacterium]